jgi:hypothetical protein
MPRMPTDDSLGYNLPRSQGIPQQRRDMTGEALAGLGRTAFGVGRIISDEADKNLQLKRGFELRQKEEDDALDLTRARADWNKRRLEEDDKYKPENNPDYSSWEKGFTGNIDKHRKASASIIRDPKLREKFEIETSDDVVSGTLNVRNRALGIDREKRKAEAIASVEDAAVMAARPGLDPKVADEIVARTNDSIEALVEAGTLTPGEALEMRRKFVKQNASLRLDADKSDNPARTKAWLEGNDYYSKLSGKESGGKDDAKASTSSATGRYQFTEGTWASVMKAHPELQLTADGRTDRAQQERAIRAFTTDNAKALRAAGQPVTEATLYLAHFMGAGGAIKMLTANPNQDASKAFPEAAKANPTIFNGRSIGEVIAIQTNGFDGQYGPAPEYYSLLDPAERQAALDEVTKVTEKDERDNMVVTYADYIVEQARGDEGAVAKMISEIKDLDARKDVSAIVDATMKRNREAMEQDQTQRFEASFGSVSEALANGKPRDAIKAIDPLLPPTEQEKLREHIRKGVVREDDQATLDKLTALWIDKPEEFARYKLTDDINSLTTSTIAQFRARQDSILKGEETPEDKTIRTTVNQAKPIIDGYLNEIGIPTSGKVKEKDTRYANAIRSIVVAEIEKMQTKLGRQPSVGEVTDLVKTVFKAHPTTSKTWWGGEKKTDLQFDEVFSMYDEKGWDYEGAAAALRKQGKPVTAANLMDLYEKRAAKESQ